MEEPETSTPPPALHSSKIVNDSFLLEHGQRWLSAILRKHLPAQPLAQLLQNGRLLGYLAATISARSAESFDGEQDVPTAEEMCEPRKAASVLKDVNDFLTLCAKLGVDSNVMFGTRDIVDGRNTPQVCRTLWGLSQCCQQLNVQGVPPFASDAEEEEWRLLMQGQGSALAMALRYGRLSTSRRSRDSNSRISAPPSPVQLQTGESLPLPDGGGPNEWQALRGVLDFDSVADGDAGSPPPVLRSNSFGDVPRASPLRGSRQSDAAPAVNGQPRSISSGLGPGGGSPLRDEGAAKQPPGLPPSRSAVCRISGDINASFTRLGSSSSKPDMLPLKAGGSAGGDLCNEGQAEPVTPPAVPRSSLRNGCREAQQSQDDGAAAAEAVAATKSGVLGRPTTATEHELSLKHVEGALLTEPLHTCPHGQAGRRDRRRILGAVAVAVAGLAAGLLVAGTRQPAYVTILPGDDVTRVPRRMMAEAMAPKPRHDPWRSVWK